MAYLPEREVWFFMVILGLILLILGFFTAPVLIWIGLILIVVGLVLNLVPVGGTRRRWY